MANTRLQSLVRSSSDGIIDNSKTSSSTQQQREITGLVRNEKEMKESVNDREKGKKKEKEKEKEKRPAKGKSVLMKFQRPKTRWDDGAERIEQLAMPTGIRDSYTCRDAIEVMYSTLLCFRFFKVVCFILNNLVMCRFLSYRL